MTGSTTTTRRCLNASLNVLIGLSIVAITPDRSDAGNLTRAFLRGAGRSLERSVGLALGRSAGRTAEKSLARGIERAAARSAKKKAASRAGKAARRSATRSIDRRAMRSTSSSVTADFRLKKARAFDAYRDARTPAKPLRRGRTVERYVTRREAAKEMKTGVPGGVHTTATITNPPKSAAEAAKRFGITPDHKIALKVALPKGHPVKRNMVAGGEAGIVELRLDKGASTKAILGYRELP